MSDRISKSKIPEALDALRSLGAKELDDLSAREAIRKMRRQIERVLRLGYTYEEVSVTLASLDINISGERIKYLLNDIRKKTRKKSKPFDGDEIPISNSKNVGETDIDANFYNGENEVHLEMPLSSNSPEIGENNVSEELKRKPRSKSAQLDKVTSTSKPTNNNNNNNNNNNTHDNNTHPLAFQPQLIDDEDL